MTATEMWREAEIIYESIASDDAPGYETREWSYLLTQAQEKALIEIIESGADRGEQKRLAVGPLMQRFSEALTLADYEATVTFPTNVFHPEAEEAKVGTNFIHISAKPHDYVIINRNNSFLKPYEELWWRYAENGTHVIMGDTATGDFTYNLVYVRKPVPIIIEPLTGGETLDGIDTVSHCELHNSVHRRIVSTAAFLAKSYTPEQIRMQLQAATKQVPAL